MRKRERVNRDRERTGRRLRWQAAVPAATVGGDVSCDDCVWKRCWRLFGFDLVEVVSEGE
ncbi:hypothetical protein TSUD_306110 [Trifolium subterraneum]|uniref:Uncharacterized protein n=1 Tax=Trifolium subterraneum TaxID=3900 RepID=A0A2Z6LZS7_TRISU|nr:hypothetical protein TSUD_306110 [Trifolium subterraneum]